MAASNSPPTPPLKKRKLSPSSSSWVSEEIIGEILARLPSVKSVIKCTAVCKSWKYLIQSPSFIDAHLRRRLLLNQNQIADKDDYQLADDDDDDDVVGSLHLLTGPFYAGGYLLYWDQPASASASFLRFDSTNSKGIAPFTYRRIRGGKIKEIGPSDYDLVGTCNGLICLANDVYFSPEVPTIIWNPSVRKLVTLPPSTIPIPWTNKEEENVTLPYYISTAFGYDSRTNDYKVLRIFCSKFTCGSAGNTPYGVEVYSLARGSWKTLSPAPPAPPAVSIPGCHVFCSPGNVFVNGAVHWLVSRDQSSGKDVIVSFDMATESFGEIEIPKPLRKTPGASSPYNDDLGLSVHEESLALVKMHHCERANTCDVKLWVMQQYGVVKSWTNLYSVTLNKLAVYSPLEHFGFKSNGEQVFEMLTEDRRSAQLQTVDFKTKQVKCSRVDRSYQYESMNSFVESLVLLDQSNAYSY